MKETSNIAFIIRQAGTAAAFIPIIRTLTHYNIIVFCYDTAEATLKASGYSFKSINCFEDAINGLESLTISMLITGTSRYVEDDSKWWYWANRKGLRSFAFVDQWCNYKERFFIDNQALAKQYMPDKVLVIDKFIKDKVVHSQLNIHNDNIIITGTPALDRWIDIDREAVAHKSNILRKPKDALLVLYVCEPNPELHYNSDAIIDLNFTQRIEVISSALCKLSKKIRRHIKILIKPHPIQEMRHFKHPLPSTSEVISYDVVEGNTGLFALSVDIVVGHNSILLYESAHWGKPSISLLENNEPISDMLAASTKVHKAYYHDLEALLEKCVKQSRNTIYPTESNIHTFITHLNLKYQKN